MPFQEYKHEKGLLQCFKFHFLFLSIFFQDIPSELLMLSFFLQLLLIIIPIGSLSLIINVSSGFDITVYPPSVDKKQSLNPHHKWFYCSISKSNLITRSTSEVDSRHWKVKEQDNSLTKNYCITISNKKISSIHKFILKTKQVLGCHEPKGHSYFWSLPPKNHWINF